MSLRINFNSAAMVAHRNLSGTDSATARNIEKLSSGLRINNAGDDPAGLVISEKLRAQVSGLGQAIKNGGDAVNMVKTAEGALTQVNSLLRSMRDLAVHAANAGANDAASVAADQAQIANAIASINNISSETQFGNKKLLDGTAGVKTSVTGLAVTNANFNFATTLAATDTVSVTTTVAAKQATITSADFGADSSTAIGSAGNFSLTGNGKTVTIAYTAVDTAATMATKINAHTADTGIVADASANDGTFKMTTQAYGSQATISTVDKNGAGASATVITGAASSAAVGVDVKANVTHTGGAAGDVSDAVWASGSGTVLMDSLGNTIDLTVAAATQAPGALGAQATTTSGSLIFQLGAYAGQTRTVNIASTASGSLGIGAVTGKTLSDINVTTSAGAQDALKILDKAISDISTQRANLGATQKNVLESSINSLTIAKENIAASESSIRDTDMADEMVNFTKNNIMQQAGISMLSQANQSSQALLSLLR